MLLGEAREKPNGQSARIRTRLVGIVHKILDGFAEIRLRIEIQFVMFSSVVLCDLPNVPAFIETPAAKSDRESLQRLRGFFRGVMEHSRRIQPSTEPNSHGHIRDKMLADSFSHEAIKFVASSGKSPLLPGFHLQFP